MFPRIGLLWMSVVFLAQGTGGQAPGGAIVRIPDSCRKIPPIKDGNDKFQQILLGLDPATAESQTIIAEWLRDREETVRAFAVRWLGRWERAELVATLAPMLSDPSAGVRREAANALGQAVQNAAASGRAQAAGEVAALLGARLGQELEPSVRGVICETLGRLGYADPAAVQGVEKILVDATWAAAGSGGAARGDAPVAGRLGAVKGLEALLRQQVKLFTPADATVARLREMALARPTGQPGPEGDDAARVRRLALLALAPHAKADEETLGRALGDLQWEVRRIAVRLAGAGLRTAPAGAAKTGLELIRRGLADSDWHVRYEAVSAYARNQDAPDAAPVLRATGDRSAHVALLAIDELRRCRAARATDPIRVLRDLLGTLPAPRLGASGKADDRASWHRAAHAIVAVAYAAPDDARRELGRFRTSSIWQVRMYAARAAAVLKDGAALRELAEDADDNVRNAAVSGLSQIEQHGADDVYVRQLARGDCQLLMTAARALRGSKGPGAVPALLSALGGQTRQRSSTSRDARLALLERVGELGTAEHAAALQPLLADFDPRVAAAAAAILERWAGLPSGPRDRLPSGYGGVAVEEVRRLDGATAVVRMKKGGSFTLALLAWEAPETAVGFARLAECGYYNGLTFHRVEPNFVVQGGSPGANEYAGYKSYMRDEVGLASNVRGTVGLSTRGRDTGDAQWYVNLADNARLDHNYTVFATVTSGMDVVDGVLEGDEIAEVRLVLPAGRRTK